jgi:oligoribonuclease NrnB/cAMP/cGMP phosphodiesterase (DHH superfamily)
MKKIKLFTHVDLDGTGCAIVLNILRPDASIVVEYCTPSTVDFFVNGLLNGGGEEYDEIFITDLSVNEETAQRINIYNLRAHRSKIKLFDHHKTAEHLNFVWANVCTERSKNGVIKKMSGTNLFYEYLTSERTPDFPTALKQFVEYVRLYDTWEWKNCESDIPKDLHNILSIIGIEDFVASYSAHINDFMQFNIMQEHETLLYWKNKEIDAYIASKLKQVNTINFENNIVAILFAENNLSALADKILDRIPCDYCSIFTGTTMSLRSRGEFDVSKVAKRFGGGGHKNAAGFTIPYQSEIFKNLLNLLVFLN